MPSLRTARATDRASIWSDFPASRSPRRETPHELRRDPDDALPGSHERALEVVRYVPAVLQRPHDVRVELVRPLQRLAVPGVIRWDLALVEDLAGPGVDGGECVGALVGIRSNHDHLRPSLHSRCRVSGSPADTSELGRLPRSYEVTPVIPDGGGRHNGLRSDTSPTNRLKSQPTAGRDLTRSIGRQPPHPGRSRTRRERHTRAQAT